MEMLLLTVGVGVAALFLSLLAAFAGGGYSLMLFPVLGLVTGSSYLAVLTATKISAAVMTIVAAKVHYKRSKVDLKIFFSVLLGQLIGTAIGTYLVQYQLNEWLYKKLLAFLLIGTAVYLFFSKERGLGNEKLRKVRASLLVVTFIYSLFLNILNGLFGGTGMLLTLFLILIWRLSFIHATAYTMLTYVIVNNIQAIYLAITESFDLEVAIAVTIGSLLGAYFGTHLQYLKGNLWVKRAAIVAMLAIGTKALFG